MAVSKTVDVHGLLNLWPEITNEDIWRFNQILGTGVPSTSCSVYVTGDREQVARALSQAYLKFSAYLSYFPSPRWFEETISLKRSVPWTRQELRTRYGYIEAFGQRGSTLIQANVPVVYSDQDGDGVNDTATISVVTAIDEDEVQLFFRTADGALTAGDTRYQIDNLLVSAAAGTVTLKGHRALFVSPALIWDIPYIGANRVTRNAADPTSAAGFVTTVDVYRVYNDTTTPLQVISDPIFTQSNALNTSLTNTGTARIIDSQIGLFMPRVDDCCCEVEYAESVRVYYKSGYPLQFGRMDDQLLEGIVRLANTLMPRKLCTFCDQTREVWEEDRENGEAVKELANNPFGIKKGQMFAWQVVADRALMRTAQL